MPVSTEIRVLKLRQEFIYVRQRSPGVTIPAHSIVFWVTILLTCGNYETKEVGMRELVKQLGQHKEKETLDLCATLGGRGLKGEGVPTYYRPLNSVFRDVSAS
jgi:hypothetical protein